MIQHNSTSKNKSLILCLVRQLRYGQTTHNGWLRIILTMNIISNDRRSQMATHTTMT
jgi:hypothetical protein